MGRVTLQGWLAQWRSVSSCQRIAKADAQHDYTVGSSYSSQLPRIVSQQSHNLVIAHRSLGYSSSPATDLPAATALNVTRPRKQDRRQRKVTRSVFLCYVLGATGSGKTSLLRSFVSKGFRGGEDGQGGYEPTTKVLSVVNSVEMEGVEKYLVVSGPQPAQSQHSLQLQEFGSKYESETLRNSKKLDMADIVIYVHDSSDTNSFSYISNLRVRSLVSCDASR